MILLLDLCDQKHPLSRDEFVLPIARIVQRCNRLPILRHYIDFTAKDMDAAEGMILCGTALRDNTFIRHLDKFRWLQEEQIPVLGICAGMQIIAAVWGGTIEPGEEIGMTTIRTLCENPLLEGRQEFPAYELHSFSPVPPDCFQILAFSSRCSQVIGHHSLPQFGVLFHPEVRNEWVVERFLHRCGKEMD
jgi:GMP synthase-like glutamine amidotransferase